MGYSGSCVAFCVTGSALFGYAISVMNTLGLHITLLLRLCGDDISPRCERSDQVYAAATTLLFIGAAIGSLCGGSLASTGRRRGLAVTHSIFVVGAATMAFPYNIEMFYAGRFIVGLGVGFCTVVVPLYISEMTPVSKRGARGVLHQLFVTIGIFGGIALGMIAGTIDASKGLPLTSFQVAYVRFMLFLPGIVSAVALVLLLSSFKDETPTFLISSEDHAKAAVVLQKIYGQDDVTEEMKEIVLANEEKRQMQSSGMSIFSCSLLRTYGWVISFAIILSIGQQLSGVNVFMAMSTEIFEDAGLPENWTTTASTAMALTNVLMTFPPIYLVEKFGRRTLLITAVFFQTLALACYPIVAVLFGEASQQAAIAAVVSVMVFVVCFAIGYGPILWLYLPEIFPPEIKEMAAGVASAANWTACIAIIAFGSMISSPVVKFAVFASASLFSFFWILFFMRETKGLSYSPYFPLKTRGLLTRGSSMGVSEEEVALMDEP